MRLTIKDLAARKRPPTAKQFTDAFKAWVRKQGPKRDYETASPKSCALGQFCREWGALPFCDTYIFGGSEEPYPKAVYQAALDNSTFGDLTSALRRV